MEKFSLKWNDFEANASKSFRNLRAEEHFFDVTLVSDDEHLLSAHKLVLSASSDFFKNILRKSTHSSPLVYLPGVKSAVLNSIIDYIYNGEVHLYQDDLDNFLDVAQKLRIEGLIGEQNEQNNSYKEKFETNDGMFYNYDTSETDSNIIVKNEGVESNPRKTKYDEHEKSVSLGDKDYSKEELAKVVDDLIITEGNLTVCKSCGKTSKWRHQMRQHVEIHIEGLSFPCPQCDHTFRSRNILKCHNQRFHKNVK